MYSKSLFSNVRISLWKYMIVCFVFAFNTQYLHAQDTTVIVNPVNDIYVANGNVVPTIVFTGTADVYYWHSNGVNIGMTSSYGGYDSIPTFTATNHSPSLVSATITVYPINMEQDSVFGYPITFTINVYADSINPYPYVLPISTNTIRMEIRFLPLIS